MTNVENTESRRFIHVRAHRDIRHAYFRWFYDVGEIVDMRNEERTCVHFHFPEYLTLEQATSVLYDAKIIGSADRVTALWNCGIDFENTVGHVAALNSSDQEARC
jgi:hypothetical protein